MRVTGAFIEDDGLIVPGLPVQTGAFGELPADFGGGRVGYGPWLPLLLDARGGGLRRHVVGQRGAVGIGSRREGRPCLDRHDDGGCGRRCLQDTSPTGRLRGVFRALAPRLVRSWLVLAHRSGSSVLSWDRPRAAPYNSGCTTPGASRSNARSVLRLAYLIFHPLEAVHRLRVLRKVKVLDTSGRQIFLIRFESEGGHRDEPTSGSSLALPIPPIPYSYSLGQPP